MQGTLARRVANLANLSTPLGVLLGCLGRGSWHRRRGLLVVERVRLPWVNASAMTVGDVVLVMGSTVEEVERRFPRLMEHEEEHSWQWAYCLGLPFIPLYAAASLWSLMRAGDRATRNVFERQAGLVSGGYVSGAAQPRRRRAERSA